MKRFCRPLDIFDSEVLDCVYGQYPWDDWEWDALAAGVTGEPVEFLPIGDSGLPEDMRRRPEFADIRRTSF